MKVLHVSSESNWGGGEKQIALLLEGSIQSGLEVMALCKAKSALEDYCLSQKIKYQSTSFRSILDLKTLIQFAKTIDDFEPDIIHVHSSKAHSLIVILSAFKRLPQVIVSRRMNNPIKSNIFSQHKYNHPKINKIICVSQAVKQTLSRHVPEEKLQVIYGGIDLAATKQSINQQAILNQYPTLKQKRLIGFVGSLTEVKAPSLFIETAEIILQHTDDCHFIFIGDGELRHSLKAQLEEKGLSKHFTFTGFVQNAIPFLSSLDLLMVTSRNEGIPNVILEAFISNVPVVSVEVGGISELIEANHTGILAKRNAKELANACIQALSDNGFASELTKNATEKVSKFTYENGIRQTLALYRDVLNQQ